MDPSSTVSISVSPEMAETIADRFNLSFDANGQPVRHAAYTAGRGVLASLHDTSIGLASAELDIKRAGLTDPATVDRLRRAAVNKMNGVRKSASDGLAALQSHVDQINAGIETDLGIPTARTDVNENARAGEIRSFIRSLPQRERSEAIRKAIGEGDTAVAAAVLSASPLASGLTRKEQDFARMDAEEKFCKPAVQLRESIGKMVGLVETAINVTETRFGPLCGVGDSPAAKAARSLAALEGGAA
ncbi:MAG: hypothetical protein IT432_12575 [Phycisphaerales bacterium]|nr:hypothetical protein [Phycisphaerales bacterium]